MKMKALLRHSAGHLALVSALAVCGCATVEKAPEESAAKIASALPASTLGHYFTTRVAEPPKSILAQASPGNAAATPAEHTKLFRGSGTTVVAPRANLAEVSTAIAGDDVSLNFEGADVREVVKNILTDILNESYIFDPQVTGTVTLRTTKPISRSALIATLETMLRMNGAALVREAGIYKIVPVANAVRGSVTPQLGATGQPIPKGFSVRLVPLKFVGVREMARVLDPFVKDAASMRADDLRNMLILFGTERELQHLVNTIEMFDVDWMSGMSVGLFTLQSADVKTVSGELDKIIGDKLTGPLAGILRIIPIERLNALLVITPQPAYLEQAKQWMERLDKGGDSGGTRLFVYHVQNGRAEKLAPLLSQAFTGRAPAAAPTSTAPTLAPGQVPATVGSTPQPVQQPVAQPVATSSSTGVAVARNANIIADKDNNALIIMASPAEYALIEAALKKLDIAPRQVMIEVAIARIDLTDELDLGLQGFFTNGEHLRGSLLTPVSSGTPGISASGGGFSYIWKPPAGNPLSTIAPNGIAAGFNLASSASRSQIVARPNVMAADNQKAQIQVGQKIPTISQEQTVSGTTTGIINAIQYLDTGVILNVTPHVNSGGLISLELSTEVSKPSPTGISGITSPVIDKTTAQTTVSVQSGETLIMGGLISETKGNSSNGLPLLSEIPIIGALFGNQQRKNDRSEIVMFITPRLVSSDQQLREVTEEMRNKMEYLRDAFPAPKPAAKSAAQSTGTAAAN